MKLYPFILGIALLSGCSGGVTFEVPQPAGVKNETAFPDNFIGRYTSKEDGSVYNWQSKIITADRTEFDSFPRKRYDKSEYQIKGTHIYKTDFFHKSIMGTYFTRHDSIFATWYESDTILKLPDMGILRFYNDRYFLNMQETENDTIKWIVITLKKENDNLMVGTIDITKDIPILEKITKVNEQRKSSDTVVSYSSNPTKEEFFKFIEEGGFSSKDTLVPVKN